MASGLIALLDDVVAIAKIAAASLDDVTAQAAKAGTKAAGIVIDDAAVTPRYVVGFAAKRELPIIGKIALGSLKNKLIFLLPAALLLSFIAPWAITPLLMIGGVYLCFEGYEKIHSLFVPHEAHGEVPGHEGDAMSPQDLEDEKVSGAIRTDFILSAEIMAITLSSVSEASFAMQAVVLAAVGIGITITVYGVVALIVKADDVGAAMARATRPLSAIGRIFRGQPEDRTLPQPGALDRAFAPPVNLIGRGLVKGMPVVLSLLSIIGTAAMLWVGGGIILHGLASYGLDAPEHWIHDVAAAIGAAMPFGSAFVTWFAGAFAAGVVGLAIGAAAAPLATHILMPALAALRRKR